MVSGVVQSLVSVLALLCVISEALDGSYNSSQRQFSCL